MTSKEILGQLEAIASVDDFASSAGELTEEWSAADVGVESVEPILRFMEAHPNLEYGMPGPLVHFVEEFYLNGYEQRLVASISRKPTSMTAWMLNRVLNGTEDPTRRQEFLHALKQAARHPQADQTTVDRIQVYLERLNA